MPAQPPPPDPVPATWRAGMTVVQTVGFPVVVAGVLLWFLLMKVVPSTEELSKVIGQNSRAVDELSMTSRAQTKTYQALEEAVRGAMSVSEENNRRLRQMMGSDEAWRPSNRTLPLP